MKLTSVCLSVQLAGKAENLSLYLAGEAYISLFVCSAGWFKLKTSLFIYLVKLTSVCLSIQLASKAENLSLYLAGEAFTSLLSVQLAGKAENLSLKSSW